MTTENTILTLADVENLFHVADTMPNGRPANSTTCYVPSDLMELPVEISEVFSEAGEKTGFAVTKFDRTGKTDFIGVIPAHDLKSFEVTEVDFLETENRWIVSIDWHDLYFYFDLEGLEDEEF